MMKPDRFKSRILLAVLFCVATFWAGSFSPGSAGNPPVASNFSPVGQASIGVGSTLDSDLFSSFSLPFGAGESQLYVHGFFTFLDGESLVEGIIGPFDFQSPITSLAALDVGGVSLREEILWTDGATIFGLDLDGDGGLTLTPAPTFAVGALAAVDMAGTQRKELVAASGEDLYWLDLDVPIPTWAGPFSQGMSLNAMTALDVGGATAKPELLATDGAKVYFLDLDHPAGAWAEISPQVTFPVDMITTMDIWQNNEVKEVLLAVKGTDTFIFAGGVIGWTGPFPQRYRIVTAALTEISEEEGTVANLRESLFVLAPGEETDIRFQNVSEAARVPDYTYFGEGHSPGTIFADVDGDDLPDLYLVQGMAPNLLYRNTGQGKFDLVPNAAGANDPRHSTGALLADYDNDGDMDIYVINFGERNTLYQNRGGIYVDVTAETDPTPADLFGDRQEGVGIGIDTDGKVLNHTLTAAWADINRDGFLDLYVGNHICCGFPEGERDVLYLSNGDGTFTDITIPARIATENAARADRASQALMFADFNNDLWPDIYVTNKGDGPSRDQLFLNDGPNPADGTWAGTFTEYFTSQPDIFLGNVTGAAMGIDAGDFDNDGDLDIYLTDVGTMDLYKNMLIENGGGFGLQRVVEPNPVAAPWFSWGTAWVDADNDGDLDLHVATNDRVMDYFFRNDGLDSSGRILFRDVTVGVGLGQAWGTRAVAYADYDRDGWADVFVVNRGGTPSALFHNESATLGNHWLQVKLLGDSEIFSGKYRNTPDAIGARVEVIADVQGHGNRVRQMREVRSGSHTCASTSSLILHFGLGRATKAEVTITWPSGEVQTVADVAADQLWQNPDITSVEEKGPLPGTFALQQNYPNPFNPSTTIEYQLDTAGQVTLKIYNLTGQEMRTLVNENQDKGRHAVVWDGKNGAGKTVATGVYFYELRIGEFVKVTRKMLFLR
ncbi:MAG: FG-GAP-like repeat-containing protein [bacterium]